MRNLILVFALLFAVNSTSNGQSYPLINKEILKDMIENDKEHKFFMITIFTNGCPSINYINQNNEMIDSITKGKTKFILAQSSKGNDRDHFFERIIEKKKLPKDKIYFIDDAVYKTSKKDSRIQGMKFRENICYECKHVSIAVTYKIILDKKMNVLYYGMFLDRSDVEAILTMK